jgi:hypothetical protein
LRASIWLSVGWWLRARRERIERTDEMIACKEYGNNEALALWAV